MNWAKSGKGLGRHSKLTFIYHVSRRRTKEKMARVHLFAESSNRRRSQDPELTRLTKQSSPPAPTVVPAEDLDVTASPPQSPLRDESPTHDHNSTAAAEQTLATLTAFLQNAQQAAEATQNNSDLNDVVNVVAAHLTSNKGLF